MESKTLKTSKTQRKAVDTYILKMKTESPEEYKRMRRECNRRHYENVIKTARELYYSQTKNKIVD